MKIKRMPEDVIPLLEEFRRRITALESKPLGTVYINESLIIKDPETGVETIIGDLHGEGEDRHGIKQWVGDTTPPPIPTSPFVSAHLGVFTVSWDGANEGDLPHAPDFDHINVYGNNGTSTMLVGVIKTKDEVAIVTGAEYNVPWVFWLTSVDFNGNESAKGEDSLPVSVTPLVEELDMKEILDDINDRFGGVITEAERLNDVLADAEQTITETKTSLDNLENVRLPQVEANIEAAHQEIVSTGAELDLRLDQAEIDLNAAELGLNNLKNTDLPAMRTQIEGVHQELVTTGGQLDSRLDQAETDLNTAEAGLNTLKNVTIPSLNTRLTAAQQEITTTGAQLDTRLDKAETDLTAHNTRITQNNTSISTLNNTTLPALTTDLTSAKTRLTTAEGELSATKTRVTTAEGTLNTLKNTTIPALNTDLTNAKTRLTNTETEITGAKTRLTDAEADLDDVFGQITVVDTKAGNAQTAASNAQTAVDDAIKDLDRVWSTARRSFYWAGDTLEGVSTTGTFNPTIVNLSDAPASSSVLRKNGTNGSVYWDAKPIPFDPSALYKITFKLRVVSDATNISSPAFYAGVHAWDASPTGGPGSRRSNTGVVSVSSAHYFAAGFDPAVAADGWITVVGYFQGLAPEGSTGGGEHKNITDPGQMVSMTKYISPMALLDYSSGNGVWDVGMVAIDVVPAELQAQVVAAQAKADSAQSKADSAHTAAGTAQSTADNALTMAGSKSKVFYSTSNPSGTASLGDTWRKVNASNDVIAEWRWTAGNTWLTQQITSEVISNLDVGKLTAGSAIINTAVVNKIAIQTADVIKLNASAITAGTISADRLNVTDLAAKIATVIKLNADAITAGTIDTGRLNATEVAAAVATVIQLNASRITAGVISTDRLNATEIAARVATVIQLNASSITAGIISTDRLDVNDIAAKTASFQKVDVKNLFATTGTFSEAVIEKLWADVIRAKKITTDQLLVGSGSNLIVDPYFEDETTKAFRATLASNMSGGYGRNATTNLNWFGGTQTAGTVQTYYFSTINSRIKTDSMIPMVEGSKYRFKFLYNSTGGGARPVVGIVRKDGTNGVTASGFKIDGVLTSSYGSAGSGQIMEAVWEPAPSWDYAYFIPGIQWESTVTSAHIYGGASVQNMADGNLIVDGSIAAKQIDSLSVTAEVAKFLELDVAKLKVTAGATMNEAVITKLWTDVVRSKKITTDQLLVGQGENLIPWDVSSRFTADRTSNIVESGSTGNKINIQSGVGVADGNHLYMDANWVTSGTNTNTWRIMSDPSASPWGLQGFKVEPEEEFQAQIYVKAGGSYASGMPSVALAGVWYKADGTYIATNVGTTSGLTWSWDKREVSLKAPATAAYLHLYVRQNQPGGVRVDLPSLYRKKGASLIVDGSIAAKQIDSESVSAEVAKFIDLDVSRLVATNATINTAVVNKLWTDVIRSRKITTDMMIVGSGGNHFPDPTFTDPDGWSNSYIKTGVGRNGGAGIVIPASTGQAGTYYGSTDRLRQFPVIGGQEYRVGVWVKSAVAIPLNKITIYVKYTTPSSSTAGGFTSPAIYNTGVDGILGIVPANTWKFLEGITVMPDTAEQAFIGLYTQSGFNAAVTFSEPSVQTAAGTGLIVDGAIEAKHITASEKMSAKLGEFLTLNVENFNVTGTGKMSEAVITKLWTDVVQSKKITSNMIAIGDFSNYAIINPATDTNVVEPAGWATATEGNYTKNVSGTYLMFKNRDKNVPFFSGDKVRIVFDAKTTTGTVTTTPNIWTYTNAGAGAGTFSGNSATITTTEKTFESIISLDSVSPSAAEWVTGISSSSIGNVRVRNVRVQRMEAGELIVDGAVTALKIKGDSIESQHIKTNAVKADKIEVGAIRASHIAMGYGRELATNGDGKLKSNVGYEGFGFQSRTAGTPEGNEGYFYSGFGQGTTNFLNGDSLLRVKPDTEYRVTTWVMASAAGSVVYLQPMITGTGSVSPIYPVANNRAVPTTWTKWTETFRTSAVMDNPGMYFRWFLNHTNGTVQTTRFYFAGFSVEEMVNGTEITPNSITSANISGDAITAKHTITGALIQTDKAPETGVKLDATGIHAWGPEAKTLSITGGRGVDYIGITGYPTTETDADGNPTAFGDLQEVSNIDNTGAIMGQELSIAGTTSLAGTVVMGSEAFHPNAYGLSSPGDLGPVILGRSLIGTGFQGFVEDHPRVSTQTSWMDTIPFGVVVNTAREDLGLSWDARGGIAHTRNRLGAWFEFEKNRMYSLSYRTPGTTISGSGTGGATSLRYGGVNQNIGAGEGSQVYGSRNYLPAGEITQTSATTYVRCPEDIPAGRRLVAIEQYIYAGRTATTVGTADSARWELVIADMGLNRPSFNGTTLNSSIQGDPDPVKPPVVVAPPPPPDPPIKQYIKTWNASWWATYWVGNGNGVNSGMKSPKVAQGRPPGVGYSQRGAIGFPNMLGSSDLNGVKLENVRKVEVYVYAAHWYSSAGGTLEIGTHGHTSQPSTMSVSLVTNRKSQSLKKPEGRWVTLPSSVHAGLLSGSVRGIQAYTTSTSLSKYGYLDGKRTKIRVTYAK